MVLYPQWRRYRALGVVLSPGVRDSSLIVHGDKEAVAVRPLGLAEALTRSHGGRFARRAPKLGTHSPSAVHQL